MGFGLEEKSKEGYNQWKGRYVTITPKGINRSFSGLLKKIEDGLAILNPHQDGDYSPKKGYTRKLVNRECGVPIIDSVIQVTTRKNLESACTYWNKEDSETTKLKSEMIKKERERSNLKTKRN